MIERVNAERIIYPELSGLDNEKREIVETFISESLLSIYRKWIESGKKLPVNDVIRITTDLLVDGVQRYTK